MSKNTILVGSIDLSLLEGAMLEKKDNGKMQIVIPVEKNPSIFVGSQDKGGHIYMDVEVRETNESQYGNTHFVKLSVGKRNRELMKLSQEEVKQHSPIVGNLKPITKKTVSPIDDDLPED